MLVVAVYKNLNVIIVSFTMMLEPSEMDVYHFKKKNVDAWIANIVCNLLRKYPDF